MSRGSNGPATRYSSTPEGAPIQKFANGSLTSRIWTEQAAGLLTDKDLAQKVLELSPEDQAKFVDKVDQAYPTLNSQNSRCISALGDVCSATELLPTSSVLSEGMKRRGEIAMSSGGFTDIWKGTMYGVMVAIKALRIYPTRTLKEVKKILWKRAPTWKRLSHPNILPFRGVNVTLFQLSLVYDWGQKGNIAQYLSSQPHASRLALLFDVAKGLEYLHSLDIPHGGLKGQTLSSTRGVMLV